MKDAYEAQGFVLFEKLFDNAELSELESVLERFHECWLRDHHEFYAQRAINSAYITGPKYLDDTERRVLFEFIGSNKIAGALAEIISSPMAFMNTQLFFDPANKEQKNYWHRDGQYNDLSIQQQQEALTKVNVLHFRVPLRDERGVELVPGSHARWDSAAQFDVRLERNGRSASDDLEGGSSIALKRGDLLVFSGNMIHRGLYGGERLSFDMLFCDASPAFMDFVAEDALPTDRLLERVQQPAAFLNTRRLKAAQDSSAAR